MTVKLLGRLSLDINLTAQITGPVKKRHIVAEEKEFTAIMLAPAYGLFAFFCENQPRLGLIVQIVDGHTGVKDQWFGDFFSSLQ